MKLDWTLMFNATHTQSTELWRPLHQILRTDYASKGLLKENERMTEVHSCGKCCISQLHKICIKSLRQALLDDGFSIGDVSQHHALDDAVVLLFWQIFVRHQWGAVFGSWRWVHPLKPCVALDLLQRCPPLWIPLKHSVYQAVKNRKRRWGCTF